MAPRHRAMRVLVCGSRTWDYQEMVDYLLGGVYEQERPHFVLIEGCAPGADQAAEVWAAGFGSEYPVPHEHYPADWVRHGKAAGPIRNQQMLDSAPDLVLAFRSKGVSRGTDDMVRRSRDAGVPTYVITRVESGHQDGQEQEDLMGDGLNMLGLDLLDAEGNRYRAEHAGAWDGPDGPES